MLLKAMHYVCTLIWYQQVYGEQGSKFSFLAHIKFCSPYATSESDHRVDDVHDIGYRFAIQQ